ncbi:MAG: autotransporter-associated beta strand repeat-containing protein, partial [Mycobacterium sp.]
MSNLAPTPGTAYWTGAQGVGGSGSWNTLTGGIANNSNWSLTADGLNVAQQVPGATSDVYFSGATATGSPITASLGANTSIQSLHFTNVGGAVTVGGGGGNTLTVGTGGITVDSGAPAPIINSPVALGVAQTWTNNSANDLTANGAVSGAFALTKAGTGTLVLGGSNTFTGGLVINDGAVRVANTDALNSTTPQAVTFGPSAPSTAKFQTNGNSITIGALATDATPGTPIVENANVTPATLSVSQATNTVYAGVIQDGTGGGALSFVKRGTGTLSLSGANTYTGTTLVGNGRLLVDGSIGAGAVSVTANADNRTALLGGTGTVNGAVTVTTPTGSGRSNVITAGDVGTTGTLTLGSGLTIQSGAIASFDINDGGTYDSIHVTGNLTLMTGMIVQVPPSLTSNTSYDLFTYTGTGPAS